MMDELILSAVNLLERADTWLHWHWGVCPGCGKRRWLFLDICRHVECVPF
jgi:hypothetical protein